MDYNKREGIMENVEKHIEELDLMLKNKGYNGYFLSNWGYADKLKTSMNAFVKAYLKGEHKSEKFPPTLSTYSLWQNEALPYVRCNFQLDYDNEKGFRIKTLEVESFNANGAPGKKATVPLRYCSDLPERQQANALVSDHDLGENRKKRLKI